MQFNQMELIQGISRYLAFVSSKVEILNAIGDFSVNKYAENAFINMFNSIYEGKFINANTLQKNNPSIDLIDESKNIGIQITSTAELSKIKACLEKYFKHNMYSKVDTVYVYIITKKQKKYSQANIDKHIKNCFEKYGIDNKVAFNFNCEKQVLDKAELIKLLHDRNNVELMHQVYQNLKDQFEALKPSDSVSSYNDFLKVKFDEIVLNDSMGMTLKDIYVEPNFKIHKCNIASDVARDGYDEFQQVHDRTIHDFVLNYLTSEQPISLIRKKSRTVLLLGYPGQGKTSFCKKLLNDYLSTERDKRIFYFRLKDVTDSRLLVEAPLSVLHTEVEELYNIEISRYQFGSSIWVLDGLDELYMKENLQLDDIEKFCRELNRLIGKYPLLNIVVTSRYGYVDLKKIEKDDILILQLSEFSKNQQIAWLNNYSKFHTTWLTVTKLNTFNTHNKREKQYIVELIEQPLLLHIIASLQSEVSKDVSRTSVYDLLFSELIERNYSEDGQISSLKPVSKQDLRELIQEIAFAIYKTGAGFIHNSELLRLDFVQRFSSKFTNASFKDNLKGVMISFYFKESEQPTNDYTDSKNYAIEFLHKSLEEYMVSERIVRSFREEILNKDMRGNFIIDTHIKMLNFIQRNLAVRPLSFEVINYIEELFEVVDVEEKEMIAQRISEYFEQLIEHDFIERYNCTTNNNPLNHIFYCFTSLWAILKILVPRKNYLASDTIRKKMSTYIRTAGNDYCAFFRCNLSYQTCTDMQLTHCWSIADEYDNIKVDFSNSDFYASFFTQSGLYDCLFDGCEFARTSFGDSMIVNCKMTNADFYKAEFDVCIISNVDFSGSSMRECRFDRCTFENMRPEYFTGVDIDFDTLIQLLLIKVPIDLNLLERVISDVRIVYTKKQLLKSIRKVLPSF